ncbi:21683_t:CDS:2 [Cetraspora pellucida]|uniref:21683_t:CDS:1 n=1 Tax=Cetraspora pellucida TaxID=1433469 RepID=A0A9N9GJC7_9GLOM|nr:21683_t:CDS:2 [Cetraspora pellucida]
MKFPENFEQFFDIQDSICSFELEIDETDKDVYSDKEFDNLNNEEFDNLSNKEFDDSSDKKTTSKNSNETIATTLNNLIKKLQQCCSYKEKCNNKILLEILNKLTLESLCMNKKKHRYLIIILIVFANPVFWLYDRDVVTHLCNWICEYQLMLPKPHSNIGHHSKNILPVETINKVKLFIKSLDEQHNK